MGGSTRGVVLAVVAVVTGGLLATAVGAVAVQGMRGVSAEASGSEVVPVAAHEVAPRPSVDVVGSWGLSRPKRYSPNARQYGVYVSFDRDGVVRAVDGCLEYRARYTLKGRTLRTRKWRAVQRDCLGRGPVAQQPLVKTWRGRSTVRVRTVEGQRRLVVKRAGSKVAAGRRIGEPGAMILLPGLFWTHTARAGSPLVTIAQDGTLTGDSGCGWGFRGTWSGAGTAVQVQVDATTSRCSKADMAALARTMPYPLDDLAGRTMVMGYQPRNSRVTFSAP